MKNQPRRKRKINRIVDPVVQMDARLLKKSIPKISVAGDKPVVIDNESQLLADDHLVERMESLYRRINQPTKNGAPFMVADRPWEGCGLCYGSVVPDGRGWRIYYKGMHTGSALGHSDHVRRHGWGPWPICMAVSSDGLRFRKPALAGAAVKGTNIVIDDDIDDFNALRDPFEADPNKRFKLLASRGNWWAGLTPATSPDGVRWTWGEENAVTFLGDRMSYWIDPIRRKHAAWSRNYQLMEGRVIVHKETDNFGCWSDPRTSHPRLVLQPDRYDHEQAQFYGGYPFWYRSLYFAYLEVYHIHLQRIDTQLCCSRDGLKWTRLCHREVFLPNGPHSAFDSYWCVPTFNPPILKDGRLLIHYGGRPDPHGQPGFKPIPPSKGGAFGRTTRGGDVTVGMRSAFGLATLREDGFVSLDATGSIGMLETKLLRLPAHRKRLEVNLCPFNPSPDHIAMECSVEAVHASGRSLETVRLRSQKNAVWSMLRFSKSLPSEVRLRFRLRNARFYSFRFR